MTRILVNLACGRFDLFVHKFGGKKPSERTNRDNNKMHSITIKLLSYKPKIFDNGKQSFSLGAYNETDEYSRAWII